MKYNYICKDCGESSVEEQPIGSESLSVCPKCGGSYKRVIHAPTVIYKGRGFYTTDSKVEKKFVKDSEKLYKTKEKEKTWKPPSKNIVGQPPTPMR